MLDDAVSANPDQVDLLYWRGEAYEHFDLGKARAAYVQCIDVARNLKLDSSNYWTKSAKGKLAKLGDSAPR